jgi:hypothetical protein
VFASVAVVAAFTAVPAVAAEAASSPGTSAAAGLAGAFEAARHIPAADLAGVRAGTLHTGSSDGREWAIASFTPARAAVQKAAADFQDGAATGVFTKKNGTWRLVQSGLYGCAAGIRRSAPHQPARRARRRSEPWPRCRPRPAPLPGRQQPPRRRPGRPG